MIVNGNEPVARITDGDAVIFFNFRQDRMVQLAHAFMDPGFDKFSQKYPYLQNMYYATMTLYEKGLSASVAFPPQEITNGLTEILSQKGISQFHIAESEKYAHVTSFFNGGREAPWTHEEREIVTSPGSYEQRYENVPEMSADKIGQAIIQKLQAGSQFILANFANADMVGHTGNKQACIAAIQALDKNIGLVFEAAFPAGAAVVITADHGNIEETINPRTGVINKEHSVNPVPLIVAGKGLGLHKFRTHGYLELPSVVPEGVLSDVSPTILDMFGIPKPKEMTAISLLPLLFKQTEP